MRLPWSTPRPIRDLIVVPPEPEPGRGGLAVVAIIRNEGPYLREWALFHLAGGVRRFIVYDNGSTDDGARVLHDTLGPDRLTLLPWRLAGADQDTGRPLHPQILAYAHALQCFGGAFARMTFLDIDEFLVPVEADSIEAALQATGGHPNVSLPWVHFGFCGNETPTRTIVEGYRDRCADLSVELNFKLVLDPCEVTALSVHRARTRSHGDETVNDQGVRTDYRGRKDPAVLSCRHLQMNHYFTRSRQEFEAKLARGSAAAKTGQSYARKSRAKAQAISGRTEPCLRALEFARRKGLLT
ncbi:glycosyltransferase family 92 protein [Rubellimicrobium rubrum]|uniref:Glycosyltransferase family 92 protein n=1 Tax=Rubellimicrobium rubrum TaxID=2585369 RepID=A0A5C4MQV7_9RHOB|nr:glycosyltransferase family 92 protein [Rubellimicrobium rubrum]TNC48300.1 glycosyltransferase family 92 protein [Rubellimicrobium rubrum]